MSVKMIEIDDGKDERVNVRFHVQMIFGARYATIVDKKLNSSMKLLLRLPPRECVTEANFREIFANIVEGLVKSGKIANDESAACITFPAGSLEVPSDGTVN